MSLITTARTNGSFFQQRYRRLRARPGARRALVAIEYCMLTGIWHVLTDRQPYRPHQPANA